MVLDRKTNFFLGKRWFGREKTIFFLGKRWFWEGKPTFSEGKPKKTKKKHLLRHYAARHQKDGFFWFSLGKGWFWTGKPTFS